MLTSIHFLAGGCLASVLALGGAYATPTRMDRTHAALAFGADNANCGSQPQEVNTPCGGCGGQTQYKQYRFGQPTPDSKENDSLGSGCAQQMSGCANKKDTKLVDCGLAEDPIEPPNNSGCAECPHH